MNNPTALLIFGLIGISSSLQSYPTGEANIIKPRLESNNKTFPTNSWYQNWLTGDGEKPVKTYPYIVKAEKAGFVVCYPKVTTNSSSVVEQIQNNLIVTAKELSAGSIPCITQSSASADFFDLAATVQYGSAFDALVVRGYASVVLYFYSTTPIIKSAHQILNTPGSITTRELQIQLNNSQTWLIQSLNPINWIISGSDLSSNSPYAGWLKVSIAINKQSQNALTSKIDSLITNGRVSYSIDRNTSSITVTVSYNSPGLFYILPHAKNPMETCSLFFYPDSASANGVKGTYRLASGNGYRYKMPLYKPADAKVAINSNDKVNKLKEALKSDVDCPFSCSAVNYLVSAEEIYKATRLMEVAALLNDTERMNKIKDFVAKALDFWFGIGNGKPAFVYEPTWGGLILRSDLNFSDASGKYFAHHAYYGYFANAFATLAKYYSEYYAARSAFIEPLIADFAGTCAFKELPCRPRNKDAFLGLSISDGIGEVDKELQKSLISPSMAVNAYFGLRELGKALNNKSLEDLGDYLLSSEIVAAQTYWQIKQPSEIYASPFADNGIVGVLSETSADSVSIFGANVELIYALQVMPVNEMTPIYLDKNWLSSTKPLWSKGLQNSPNHEALLLADAIVDPNQSGLSEKIHALQYFKNDNSKTNTLYFYYLLNGRPSPAPVTETLPMPSNLVFELRTDPTTQPPSVSLTSTTAPTTTTTTIYLTSTNTPTTMTTETKKTSSYLTSTTTPKATSTTMKTTQTSTTTSETTNGDALVNSLDDDNGFMDARCGLELYTCVDKKGVLVSCYNRNKYHCFVGGYLCPIPFRPCVNSSNKKAVAVCYDPNAQICLDGELYFTI